MLHLDTPLAREDAKRLLDSAVGIVIGSHGVSGITLSSHAGCACLPPYLVRRVEYEAAMRQLNCSEMVIGRMHAMFNDRWYYGDVRDANAAGEYLIRATLVGNRFAKRVLDWLAPERSKGLHTTQNGGREEYIRAIRDGERERAVEIGRYVVACGAKVKGTGGTTPTRGTVRPDATMLMKMPNNEQKALAANNIGFILAHGESGLEKDIPEAMYYYEMAIKWGSASAANNLAFLLHYGADGDISPNGAKAKLLYELAIERGERNYAPRNLGVLLHQGAPGVRVDLDGAAQSLLLGLREGNHTGMVKCAKTMQILLRSWRFWWSGSPLRKFCEEELARASYRERKNKSVDADSVAFSRGSPYGM